MIIRFQAMPGPQPFESAKLISLAGIMDATPLILVSLRELVGGVPVNGTMLNL